MRLCRVSLPFPFLQKAEVVAEWASLFPDTRLSTMGSIHSVPCSRPRSSFPELNEKQPLAGVTVVKLVRTVAGPTSGATVASMSSELFWVNS